MGSLRELLATDHRQALEFFVQRLADVSGHGVDEEELLYNASVLAHYAQVSTHATVDLAAPVSLSAIFDCFVVDATVLDDGVMMETAGAQCLLLTGFFADQMRGRHNLRWYAGLGVSFFSRAAGLEAAPRKARLLEGMARHFEAWRRRHAQISRDLRDQPFLLASPRVPGSGNR